MEVFILLNYYFHDVEIDGVYLEESKAENQKKKFESEQKKGKHNKYITWIIEKHTVQK